MEAESPRSLSPGEGREPWPCSTCHGETVHLGGCTAPALPASHLTEYRAEAARRDELLREAQDKIMEQAAKLEGAKLTIARLRGMDDAELAAINRVEELHHEAEAEAARLRGALIDILDLAEEYGYGDIRGTDQNPIRDAARSALETQDGNA